MTTSPTRKESDMASPIRRHVTPQRTIIALICLASALALIIWAIFQVAPGLAEDGSAVRIVDGEGTVHEIPLSQNGSYTFSTELGDNTILIEDGSVRMTSSDCPGHDCIDQGDIDASTEMIVCMPHKLIVTIEPAEGVRQ